jgi:DNA-binding transcriptional regulator YbjK
MNDWFAPVMAGFIAVALAIVLMMLTEAQSEPVPPLMPSVYDKKLDRLDRRGIEAAYSSRVALLFQNWMTDTTKESSQRALKGHRNARQIYIEAMTNLDARDPEGKEP